MSEEDNWKVYKIELYDIMSKGTCVPFLGQFLTQILQQETVKEVISYRKKSQGRRPQSSDLSSDNRETLSAPTTPVNSDHDEVLDASLAISPTDLNVDFDQTTPTPSNVQPDVPNEETENKKDELKRGATQEEEGIKKETSGTSVVERRDTLSPLPIGKFKKNYLSPTNLYWENLKKSSGMQSSHTGLIKSENKDESDKMVNGDTAGHKLEGARCEVVKTISMESLDSYDGASSCYSRGSTPARDIIPNAPDSEVDDAFCNNGILDISQIEVNIEDSLDTPTSDFDKEGSPDVDPFTSTPTEDITIEPVNTSNEDNGVEEKTTTNIEKSPVKEKKKRKWGSLRRKVPPPEGSSHSVTNCTDDTAHKKETRKLRRNLSSPLKSFSTSSCNDTAAANKKEKGTPKRKHSSPVRDSSPSCNDETPRRKEKRSLRRKLSSPLRSHHSNASCDEDPPQRRDKLHIYNHSDVDGFNVHTTLQQMQFSSMRYMNSLESRPDVQSFIKGLQYNSEEDNYHMSIQMEPIENNY